MHPTLFLPAGFKLAITVLLAVVPLISATSPSQPFRRGLPSVNNKPDAVLLPSKWTQKSCYTDDPSQPMLTSISFINPLMTVELCVNACANSYLSWAGLENGNSCFCGNVTTTRATEISDSNCQTQCVGNVNEFCGGLSSLRLYWNGYAVQPDPIIVQSVGMWDLKGCYSDSDDQRTLIRQIEVQVGDSGNGGVSVETCVDGCDRGGYSYAGVQFANECWCGMDINPSGKLLDSKLCSVLACSGNSVEYCGASYSMIIYNLGVAGSD